MAKSKKDENAKVLIPKEDIDKITLDKIVNPDAEVKEILNSLELDEIFNIIKRSAKEVGEESLAHMVEYCEQLKDHLEITGQTEMLNILRRRVLDIGGEYKVIKAGFTLYVYEKDVRAIMDIVNSKPHSRDMNSKEEVKRLVLTQLKDYQKIVPPMAIDTIKAAKEVFDQLLILHNDPRGAQVRAEKEEERRRKAADPILFGKVSRESDKMFVLFSWADAYSDYTITDLLDDMAANAAKVTDEHPFVLDLPKSIDELVDSLNASSEIFTRNDGWYIVDDSTTGSTTSTASVSANGIIFRNYVISTDDNN